MRKGLFKGLLFREFYITRKTYMMYLEIYFISAMISLLALLSSKYGNLHTYSHLLNTNVLDIVIKFVPAGFGACFFACNMDSVSHEETVGWRRFRIFCPATPFQLALAKYSCYVITLMVSLLLTFGWLGLYTLLTGKSFTHQDLSIIMAIYCAIALLSVSISTISIWLKGKMLVGTIFGIVFGIIFLGLLILLNNVDFEPSALKAIWLALVPFIPLIILVILLLGLFCTTKLYGRREK